MPDDDDVICTFQKFGKLSLLVEDFVDNKLPFTVAPLEKFVCSVYAPKDCSIRIIPELRWELFRSKNLEGEKLPPILPTLYPHIMRSNFITKKDKSYTTTHPDLPKLAISGWEEDSASKIVPLKCLALPIPKSVIELVKCCCEKGCKSMCSCSKNDLPCTALCKCYGSSCNNFASNYAVDLENDDEA